MRVSLSILLLVACTCGHNGVLRAADLDAVIVTGSARYVARDFAAITGRFVGKTISPALVDQVTKEIQDLYRRDGYVAPRVVQVDPTIETSVPRLHVLEASIESVVVRGDTGPHRASIELLANTLAGAVVDKRRTREVMAAIEALPGIRVKAHFEPRSDISRFALVLDVRYRAVEGTAALNNRGTDEVGPLLVGGRVKLNGLLGAGEGLGFAAFAAQSVDEYRYFAMNVAKRLGRFDVGVATSTSNAEVEADSKYSTQRASLDLQTVVYDEGGVTVEPLIELGTRDSDGRDSEAEFSVQRTRWASVGTAVRLSDARTATRARIDIVKGIDAFGAVSQTAYASSVDLDFTKTVLDFIHLRALTSEWTVRIDLEAQWCRNELPSGERITFGGARFGRAFDPGTLAGDTGASASVQLQRVLPVDGEWLRNVRVFGQTDYGYVDDARYGSDAAASVTLGITGRMSIVQTTLELSQSIRAPVHEIVDEDPRAFVNMAMSF